MVASLAFWRASKPKGGQLCLHTCSGGSGPGQQVILVGRHGAVWRVGIHGLFLVPLRGVSSGFLGGTFRLGVAPFHNLDHLAFHDDIKICLGRHHRGISASLVAQEEFLL